MQSQLVSIIIPTFNRAHLLGETLDSVLEQTYTNWECIIVDDGSSDETDILVSSYVKKDKRFKYLKRPNNRPKGANACRNYGFEKSKGEFVNWFDSDDIMHKSFIELRLNELNKISGLVFCSCLYSTFTSATNPEDRNNNPLKPKIFQSDNYIEDYLLHDLAFITDSVLWRKSFLEGKLLYNEFMQRAQEWDFHFRMLTYAPPYKYLKRVLFNLRRGNESITKNANSYKAQFSVYNFFHNVFSTIKEKEIKNRTLLLRYVFYRQAVNYYNINTLAKGFNQRLNIFYKKRKDLFAYSKLAEISLMIRIKLSIGTILVLFTKKGYVFFHYPEFDKRTNKDIKKSEC